MFAGRYDAKRNAFDQPDFRGAGATEIASTSAIVYEIKKVEARPSMVVFRGIEKIYRECR